MRVLGGVDDPDVGELDVEVLVDGVEGAGDGQVVLQLHGHVLADQRLEVGVEQHPPARAGPRSAARRRVVGRRAGRPLSAP